MENMICRVDISKVFILYVYFYHMLLLNTGFWWKVIPFRIFKVMLHCISGIQCCFSEVLSFPLLEILSVQLHLAQSCLKTWDSLISTLSVELQMCVMIPSNFSSFYSLAFSNTLLKLWGFFSLYFKNCKCSIFG